LPFAFRQRLKGRTEIWALALTNAAKAARLKYQFYPSAKADGKEYCSGLTKLLINLSSIYAK